MMRRLQVIGAGLVLLVGLLALPSGAQAPVGLSALPPPADPQSWALPEWLTWDDYHPIPGFNWLDPANQAPKPLRAALILADFADRDFVVTMPPGSDVFARDGLANPINVGNVPREEVGEFYADFLINTPSELNHFHTINEYWLEDSYGTVGVVATPFGPYRLPEKEHEYGLGDYAGGSCPAGDSCNADADTDMIEASLADVTAGVALNGEDYDFRWLLHAGYDESGVWQEFGEMLVDDRENVPDSLGHPDPEEPNWVDTRYVDWTSFAAGEGIWSHAIPGVFSQQGENDGASVFAHELSHIFGVLDNYNNPYGNPVRRAYSGPWDMLSRGSFNGPGGPHTRWQIPPTLGASMGSHHMLRNKIRLGFTPPNEVMTLDRNTLAAQGLVVADIWPRAYPLAPRTAQTGLHGMQIVLTGGDRSPACQVAQDHACDGGGYHAYTVEHVQQIGHDSFTPDSGVLIAKTKVADTSPFIWVMDSHPVDINDVTGVGRFAGREIYDFIRPGSGERARISLGDYRQLSDALFHAGTGTGVVSEYVDEANGLHFYVLERNQPQGQPVPQYRVAVRSLEGSGALPRSVTAVAAGEGTANPGRIAVVNVTVTNTGLQTDLVRLASSTANGWTAFTDHRVIELAAGEVATVPVYVVLPANATGSTTLSLTATSETDPTKSATATATVRAVGQPADDPVAPPTPGGGTPEGVPPVAPGPQTPPAEQPEVVINRVAGDTRIATAVALSQATYPEGAPVAVLARADEFPDALAGGPLASALGGPLLLTESDTLASEVAEELERLGATSVTILGGEGAVSEAVADELRAMGFEVVRIGGDSRYATAGAAAGRLGNASTTAYLASGENYPDALSVSPLAAFLGRPVLLTRPGDLPDETVAALAEQDITQVVVLGGTGAVSDEVVAELEALGIQVRRLAGTNRYETSVEINEEAIENGMAVAQTWLATGAAFPDTLAAGPAIAADGGTLLLVDGQDLDGSPASTNALVGRAGSLTEVTLVGGTGAITEGVEQDLQERLAQARGSG